MIREATAQGIAAVALDLRETEIVVREKGRDGAARHCMSVAAASDWRWQLEADGDVIALFGGDADPGDDECSVWLFCRAGVEQHPLELFRGIRTCMAWGKQNWPLLVIEAEPRDQRQDRFLKMLGFTERNVVVIDGRAHKELIA